MCGRFNATRKALADLMQASNKQYPPGPTERRPGALRPADFLTVQQGLSEIADVVKQSGLGVSQDASAIHG